VPQHSGSFKVRGAFTNLLLREIPDAGVADLVVQGETYPRRSRSAGPDEHVAVVLSGANTTSALDNTKGGGS
jgi:hypothetical protein